jgi:high-affinity iron transporter
MSELVPGIIVGFREGLEAFLIIAVIQEYLNKLKQKRLQQSVSAGLAVGIVVSVLLGLLLWLFSLVLGKAGSSVGKFWESFASLLAVVFITYFIYWMIQHGKHMVGEVRSTVDSNLSNRGIFFVSMIAVAREGAEIALFAFTSENTLAYLVGNLSGVLLAAVLTYLIYKSLVRVNLSLIFNITIFYLILQAAYLAGYAIHELLSALKELKFLSADALVLTKLFDVSGTILDHKKAWLGITLNVALGWYSKPEILQSAIQVLYIIVFGTIWQRVHNKTQVPEKE